MPLKKQLDRPFQSRADLDIERALISQYREIGNPDLRTNESYTDAVEHEDEADIRKQA